MKHKLTLVLAMALCLMIASLLGVAAYASEVPVCEVHDEADWQQNSDNTGHYKYCATCDSEYGYADHEFECYYWTYKVSAGKKGHSAKCAVCGFVYGELFDCVPSEKYYSDTTYHAPFCTTCNGFVESMAGDHVAGSDYLSTEYGHKVLCSVCGYAMGSQQSHQAEDGYYATEDGKQYYQKCATCGYAYNYRDHFCALCYVKYGESIPLQMISRDGMHIEVCEDHHTPKPDSWMNHAEDAYLRYESCGYETHATICYRCDMVVGEEGLHDVEDDYCSYCDQYIPYCIPCYETYGMDGIKLHMIAKDGQHIEVCVDHNAPKPGSWMNHAAGGSKTVSVGAQGHYVVCSYGSCNVRLSDVVAHDAAIAYYPGNDNGTHLVVCDNCWGYSNAQYYVSCTPGTEGVKHDDAQHAVLCAYCDEEIPGVMADHVFGGYKGEFNSDGVYCHVNYCEVCDSTYGELVPCEASDGYQKKDEWTHAAICATCNGVIVGTEVGHTGSEEYECGEYTHKNVCAVCGEAYGYAESHQAMEDYFVTEDGLQHYNECDVCHAVYNYAAHSATYFVGKNPETGEANYQVHYEVCGYCSVVLSQEAHDGSADEWCSDCDQYIPYCIPCYETYGMDGIQLHMIAKDGQHIEVCVDHNAPKPGSWMNHAEDEYLHYESCGYETHVRVCYSCDIAVGEEEPHNVDGEWCADCDQYIPYCIPCYEQYEKNGGYIPLHMIAKDGQHIEVCVAHNAPKPDSWMNHGENEYVELKSMGAQGHAKVCYDCGLQVGEIEAHDGATKYYPHFETQSHTVCCDTCYGWTDGANSVPCTLDTYYYFDETHHLIGCSVCECASESTMEEHVHDGTYIDFNSEGHTKHCGLCNNDWNGYGELIPHTLSEKVVNDEEWGVHFYVCEDCGRNMEMESHSYGEIQTSEDGTKHISVCEICGAEDEHDIEAEDGACQTVGEAGHYQRCMHCGERVGGILPHADGGYYCYNSEDTGYHWKECRDCVMYGSDSSILVAHTYSDALGWDDSYTHSSACTVCGSTDGANKADHVPSKDYVNLGGKHCVQCAVCYGPIGVEEDCVPGDKYAYYGEEGHMAVCGICKGPIDGGDVIPHNYDGVEYNWGGEHWVICSDCGYYHYLEDCMMTGEAVYEDRYYHCYFCEACGGSEWEEHAFDYDNITYKKVDEYNHLYSVKCLTCNETVTATESHFAICTEPNTCDSCGMTGIVMHSASGLHQFGSVEIDDETHQRYCKICGAPSYLNPAHKRLCGTDVCTVCNATYTGDNVVHDYGTGEEIVDEKGHWYACACGATSEDCFDRHLVYCGDTTGTCLLCGNSYPELAVEHWYDGEMHYDKNKHWYVCSNCDEVFGSVKHENHCYNCGVCWCGYEWPADAPYVHSFNRDYEGNGTKHWNVCMNCWTLEVGDHVPSASDASKCSVCGLTIESSKAPEEHKHATREVRIEPTCTEHGYVMLECYVCGEVVDSYRLLAKGHSLDAEGACSKCSYAEPKPEVEPEAAPEAAPEVAPEVEPELVPEVEPEIVPEEPAPVIEEVKIEAAVEGEEIVPVNATLIVEAPVVEMTVEVTPGVQTKVEKVFDVKLVVENEEVALTGAVKIAIAIAEEEMASFEGKVLMLMLEDGTLIEIEYEIIDGQLVFITEVVGTFVMVDAPKAE